MAFIIGIGQTDSCFSQIDKSPFKIWETGGTFRNELQPQS